MIVVNSTSELNQPKSSVMLAGLQSLCRSELGVLGDRECVALARIAFGEAATEPANALRASAVCVVAAVRMTERVVADCVRGRYGFAQIFVGDLERGARRVPPNACEA